MRWVVIMPCRVILSPDYYKNTNVVKLSRDLLGKVLVTCFDGLYTSGIICETEAYNGVHDRASHAYGGRRTGRTEVMFAEGGLAYVYLCYGIHSLFNVVTGKKDDPHAVLVRGIIPCDGIEIMEKRRNRKSTAKGFSSGPGSAAAALGIHYSATGISLQSSLIYIEDRGIRPKAKDILTGPRVGVDYAGEDAALPYRFVWNPPSTFTVDSFRIKPEPGNT